MYAGPHCLRHPSLARGEEVVMKKKSILPGMAVALLFLASIAHATIWYVHPDSVANCIQDCLDSCSTGDTVLVATGIYHENITWPSTQGIDLMSENGRDATIIDGGGTGRVIMIGTGVDSTTVINGFTIQNGYFVGGAGINCTSGSSPIITGNIITGNAVDSAGGGIRCADNSAPLIIDNIIINNTSFLVGAGLSCATNSSPLVTGNMIADNTADFGSAGIVCVGTGTAPVISGNIITGNIGGHWGGGIGAGNNAEPIITDNIITNNSAPQAAGIGIERYATIENNIITGNIADSSGGGIACYTFSSPTITNNTITGNTATMELGGGIWCINNSHPVITDNIITDNTAMWGGGIGCNELCVPTITENIIADNTAIRAGGGIECIFSSAVINDNAITGNHALYGGGIACDQYNSAGIAGNTITNNTAQIGGGISCWMNSSPTIKHNTITENIADSLGFGAGIACTRNSSPVIDSCTIAANNGDGVDCDSSSYPEIHFCNITDNTGFGVSNRWLEDTVDAENNWWGHASGPGGVGPGTGDEVSEYVDYDPWLTEPVNWFDIEEHKPSEPVSTILQINPNPFSKNTDIRYQITDMRNTELKIYDITGRLVKDFSGQLSAIGYQSSVKWDGRDDQSRRLPSGIYFLKFTAGDYKATEKLVLIK